MTVALTKTGSEKLVRNVRVCICINVFCICFERRAGRIFVIAQMEGYYETEEVKWTLQCLACATGRIKWPLFEMWKKEEESVWGATVTSSVFDILNLDVEYLLRCGTSRDVK